MYVQTQEHVVVYIAKYNQRQGYFALVYSQNTCRILKTDASTEDGSRYKPS